MAKKKSPRDKVLQVLVSHLGPQIKKLSDFEMLELICDIEEVFGEKFDIIDDPGVETVQDYIDYFRRNLATPRKLFSRLRSLGVT